MGTNGLSSSLILITSFLLLATQTPASNAYFWLDPVRWGTYEAREQQPHPVMASIEDTHPRFENLRLKKDLEGMPDEKDVLNNVFRLRKKSAGGDDVSAVFRLRKKAAAILMSANKGRPSPRSDSAMGMGSTFRLKRFQIPLTLTRENPQQQQQQQNGGYYYYY